jgi:hypothetical protein
MAAQAPRDSDTVMACSTPRGCTNSMQFTWQPWAWGRYLYHPGHPAAQPPTPVQIKGMANLPCSISLSNNKLATCNTHAWRQLAVCLPRPPTKRRARHHTSPARAKLISKSSLPPQAANKPSLRLPTQALLQVATQLPLQPWRPPTTAPALHTCSTSAATTAGSVLKVMRRGLTCHTPITPPTPPHHTALISP